jgi:hypothetical protein
MAQLSRCGETLKKESQHDKNVGTLTSSGV